MNEIIGANCEPNSSRAKANIWNNKQRKSCHGSSRCENLASHLVHLIFARKILQAHMRASTEDDEEEVTIRWKAHRQFLPLFYIVVLPNWRPATLFLFIFIFSPPSTVFCCCVSLSGRLNAKPAPCVKYTISSFSTIVCIHCYMTKCIFFIFFFSFSLMSLELRRIEREEGNDNEWTDTEWNFMVLFGTCMMWCNVRALCENYSCLHRFHRIDQRIDLHRRMLSSWKLKKWLCYEQRWETKLNWVLSRCLGNETKETKTFPHFPEAQ